jgi:hypothetical protein
MKSRRISEISGMSPSGTIRKNKPKRKNYNLNNLPRRRNRSQLRARRPMSLRPRTMGSPRRRN